MSLISCKTCLHHREVSMDEKPLTIVYCRQHNRHVWPTQRCALFVEISSKQVMKRKFDLIKENMYRTLNDIRNGRSQC